MHVRIDNLLPLDRESEMAYGKYIHCAEAAKIGRQVLKKTRHTLIAGGWAVAVVSWKGA